MARIKSESDSEVNTTPRFDRSGAATPSTAATSAFGGDLGKRSANDSDDSVEDHLKAGSSSRATPRRSAAAKASTKLVLPKYVETSESESESTPATRRPIRNKGKGKAQIVIDDSDDELDVASLAGSQNFESDSDDDQDTKVAKRLARELRDDDAIIGAAIEASKASVGSNKRNVEIVIGTKASTTPRKARKGKGKQRIPVQSATSSDDDSDVSAFKPSSNSEMDDEDDEQESDLGEGSSVAASESELADYVSLSSEDEEETDEVVSKAQKKRAVKKMVEAEKAPRARVPMRKGASLSKEQKKGYKKLSQFGKNALWLNANHPELTDVWTDLESLPPPVVKVADQPAGLTQKLLPFQREGLHWMLRQEQSVWRGGLLADEMGMGKTIQTISLLLSDRAPGQTRPTLVMAPTVAIIQWKNEIEKFTQGFKVLVYHGSTRCNSIKEMEGYDVVLTSYAVLESNFRREQKGFQRQGKLMKEDSILHKVKWHRIILDEAHNIKDRASNTAKAAFALTARYRWCLSGTPLQNRVGELYSLIRFLGADPFSYYYCKKCDCKSLHWLCNKGPCTECGHSGMQHVCYWNNEVLRPIQKGGAAQGEGAVAFGKLALLLRQMMLRRTKVERADDLGLPPRVVQVRRDYFTEEEEEMYMSLFKDVKRKFNTYADEGTVLNNYSNIFTLITRMRQCADHPDLVIKSKTSMPVDHAPADKVEEILTCRMCLDEADDAVTTGCRHIFCRECIRQYIETSIVQDPDCPACHASLSIDLEQDALQSDTTGRQGFLARIDPTKSRTSTKIEALIEELTKLRAEDHTLKSLVFSQFTSMLDLVARRLQIAGFKCARLQGNMTPTARDNTIKYFMQNAEVTVFLISLKAGGVALNLTEASRVFILDPWWNPASQSQAMDRIHRIGQHRPLVVKLLIIENSIESRILELQKKKENLAGATLGDDDAAMNRLAPEDLRFLFSL